MPQIDTPPIETPTPPPEPGIYNLTNPGQALAVGNLMLIVRKSGAQVRKIYHGDQQTPPAETHRQRGKWLELVELLTDDEFSALQVSRAKTTNRGKKLGRFCYMREQEQYFSFAESYATQFFTALVAENVLTAARATSLAQGIPS